MNIVRSVLAVPVSCFGIGMFAGFCFALGVTTVGLGAISCGRGPL